MRLIIDIIKYKILDIYDQFKIKKRFYNDKIFFSIDRSLLKKYFFKNPYTISKNYLIKKQEEDIHIYGETPLFTYELIARKANLTDKDTFLDLGCGRGRGLFFINHFFKCKTIGIERIQTFVDLATIIIEEFKLKDISIFCKDMLLTKLPKASIFYIYGTNLREEEIKTLILKLKTLPRGSKIITITYPLTDYSIGIFQIKDVFLASFPWGKTNAYLQIVK